MFCLINKIIWKKKVCLIETNYNDIVYQRNHFGIYCIECVETGVKYIGQTYENFYRRWIFHKWNLKANQHNNTYLQNSWNKYGLDNFRFYPIESFDLNQKDTVGKEKLNELERYYIEKYNTFENGFNLTTGGEECKMKPLSEESKRKIGEKNRINMTGKKASEETKKKMSDAHKKIMQSEEERKKRSIKLQGSKSYMAKCTEELIEEIRLEYMKCVGKIKNKDLAKKYNVSECIISDVINHKTWKHVLPKGWQDFLIDRNNKKNKQK